MAKWKLIRQSNGDEVYTFSEGEEITVGRGVNNAITLSSIVISRNHCVIKFQEDNALITDLKSSNGTYIGIKKIPQCTPNVVKNLDIIGFGWTTGAPVVNINDSEKFVFKLIKEDCRSPIIGRITFEDEYGNIQNANTYYSSTSPEHCQIEQETSSQTLKRKLDISPLGKNEIIEIPSDSETEESLEETNSKKVKLNTSTEDVQLADKDKNKSSNEYLEYEAFHVKQEYLVSNEEPIQVDDDTDSDSDNWFLRLSQSSPGKPFIKKERQSHIGVSEDNSSYSQSDDFACLELESNENDEEEMMHDIISIPPQPPDYSEVNQNGIEQSTPVSKDTVYRSEIPSTSKEGITTDAQISKQIQDKCEVDGIMRVQVDAKNEPVCHEPQNEAIKKAQMIEPLIHEPKKHKSTSKETSKVRKPHSKSKKKLSNSQKEERKRKLKDIAKKEKEMENKTANSSSNNIQKSTTKVKLTTLNRGAFLTDIQAVVKPLKSKESPRKVKSKVSETDKKTDSVQSITDNIENDLLLFEENQKKQTEKDSSTQEKRTKSKKVETKKAKNDSRLPLKSLKPLSECEDTLSGKPFSKVEPMPPKKKKKKVRFSENPPKVHEFEIESGNQMKKTSLVKKSLVDIQQRPVFSLEKVTLIKILRWNPHWLDEQINNNEPPPILGHNNPPMSIFHSFVDHKQYIQLIGDLLLMEIWECLTVGYKKIPSEHGIQMRIESLPPAPQDRMFDLFNLSVNISLPSNEAKNVPKVGEIIIATFGPKNAENQRFFFVHNVRCLPSPPTNKYSFFSVSLHATFTEKMRCLKPGEVMLGRTLAYINKELTLFEAIEYLAASPLRDAILKPDSRHFVVKDMDIEINSQWTVMLNPSQQAAVRSSVSAALGERASIQMVQGPPGTGKSSVICAIVMTYFCNVESRRRHNKGKILICATSNAAVDELVLRLLNIRQNLPKAERFRMVRVGRAESMHPRALDISSQQLAQRDANARQENHAPGVADEIFHLEAKINMWKTAANDAKDPARVAYCQHRISELDKRMALVRVGRSGAPQAAQLAFAERRIIEGADIVITTLASAYNQKMRGLKRRIALCIIDEAGQAIEPETLIPLTLDVAKITLIGDPQQLPGYICSQRAKRHGLGESLFSRLTSCAERWPTTNPVILLNEQYRMHPAIANYPNRAFYNGQIQTVAPPRPKINIPPYIIVGISSGDKGQGPSGANETEAWGVSRLVLALHKFLQPLNLNLAVITPYNAHKELIRKNLKNLQEPGEASVEVNSVDSFQGQERDVVVVSVARSHGVGFLTDLGRMNVMLTRARYALLVCLNPHALLKNYQWRTLVEDAQKRTSYRELPSRLCQAPSGGQSSDEDILQFIR